MKLDFAEYACCPAGKRELEPKWSIAGSSMSSASTRLIW